MRKPKQAAELIASIIRAVSDRTGVSCPEIHGRSRIPRIARARQIAMKLIREHGFSYPEIGIAFRHKDHGTAYYAVQKIGRVEREDKIIAEILCDIRKELAKQYLSTPL